MPAHKHNLFHRILIVFYGQKRLGECFVPFRLFFSKVSRSNVPSSRFHTMAVAEVARRAAFHTSAWQNTPEPFITSI